MEDEVIILPKSKVNYQDLRGYQQQQFIPQIAKAANIETELNAVLDEKNIAIDQKYTIYQRLLEELLRLRKQFTTGKSEINRTESKEGPFKNDIIESTIKSVLRNKPQQEKAVQILNYLKQQNNLTWDFASGVLKQDGKDIPNSNIIELLHYFTGQRLPNKKPAGTEEMIKSFKAIRLPINMVHKKISSELMVGRDFPNKPQQDIFKAKSKKKSVAAVKHLVKRLQSPKRTRSKSMLKLLSEYEA